MKRMVVFLCASLVGCTSLHSDRVPEDDNRFLQSHTDGFFPYIPIPFLADTPLTEEEVVEYNEDGQVTNIEVYIAKKNLEKRDDENASGNNTDSGEKMDNSNGNDENGRTLTNNIQEKNGSEQEISTYNSNHVKKAKEMDSTFYKSGEPIIFTNIKTGKPMSPSYRLRVEWFHTLAKKTTLFIKWFFFR